MALPYELLIGLRYTRAKKHNHFISFISLISMFGIALGVAALIVVLSVMNGFQTELRSRILAVVSHVQITGAGGEMAGWQRVASRPPTAARDRRRTVRAGAGHAGLRQTVRGALVRGILPDQEDQGRRFPPAHEKRQLDACSRTASTSSSVPNWRARSAFSSATG
jgi:lipoprotein-releasing system permease protein